MKTLPQYWLVSIVFVLIFVTGCTVTAENTEQKIHVAKHTINSALILNYTLRDKVNFDHNLEYLKRSRATVDLIEAFDSKRITRGQLCVQLSEEIVKESLKLDPDYLNKTINELCTSDSVTPESMLMIINQDLQDLLIKLQKIEQSTKIEGGG